eukprot:m.24194 g.24194  ORF g.24194 m.24194 type:complete len:4300 (+) comp28574_c0_seq1:170-13069(+)
MESLKNGASSEGRLSSSFRAKRESREELQAKVYTRWMNYHLAETRFPKEIRSVKTDLKDGRALLALIEALTGQRMSVTKGNLEFHHRDNLDRALKFLRGDRVLLVNLTSKNILSGHVKMILVLMEAIVLRYHVKDAGKNQHQVRELVFHWVRECCAGYENVRPMHNFGSSFSDGLGLSALLHSQRPSLFAFEDVIQMKPAERVSLVLEMAKKEWKVPQLVDPLDIACAEPDDKIVFIYVACLYNVFPHTVICPSQIPRFPSVSKERRSQSPGGYKIKKSSSEDGIAMAAAKASGSSHVAVRLGSASKSPSPLGDGSKEGRPTVRKADKEPVEKKSSSVKIQLGSSKQDPSPKEHSKGKSKIQASSSKTIKIQNLRADVQSMSAWLADVEQTLEVPPPSQGANPKEVRTVYSQHQEVMKSLHEKNQEVTSLLDQSQSAMKSQPASEDIRGLHKDLGELSRKWNHLTSVSRDKGRKISKVVVSAQDAQLGTMEVWFDRVEKQLVSWDGETEEWQEEHLKLNRISMEKFRDVVTDTYLLTDMSANTQRQFKQRLERGKRHWEKIQRLLDMKRLRLERKEDLYGVYMARYDAFVKLLEKEKLLLKGGGTKGRRKTDLERFQKRKETMQEELTFLQSDGEAFMKMHPEREESADIKSQLDSVSKEWTSLCHSVEQETIAVSYGLDRVMELKGRFVEVSGWMKKVEKERLQRQVSLEDIRDIEKETEELKKIQSEISSRQTAVKTLGLAAKHLSSLAKGKQKKGRSERDAEALLKMATDFQKTWSGFCKSMTEKSQKMEKAQINLQRFSGKMEELFNWLDEAENVLMDPPEPVTLAYKNLASSQSEHLDTFEQVCTLGSEILQEDAKADTVKTELSNAKQRWHDVDLVLQQRFPPETGSHGDESLRDVGAWLNSVEAEIIDIDVERSQQKDGSFSDVLNRAAKIDNWASELKQHQARVQSADHVKFKEILERLSDVSAVLHAKENVLEASKKEMNEFEQSLDDLTAWIETSRKVLRGRVTADEESKGRLRVLEVDLENRKSQVKKLSIQSVLIVAQSIPKQAASTERKLEVALRDFNQLSVSLASKWKEAEPNEISMDDAVKEIEALERWLTELQSRMEAASEVQGIEEQFQQCQSFRSELSAHQADFTDATRHMTTILSTNESPETSELSKKHKTLREKYAETCSTLDSEKDRLQATLAFARSLMDAQDWLSSVEERLDVIAESPLGHGISAKVVLEKCTEFRENVESGRGVVAMATVTSQAELTESDKEFVDACRERLSELNSRFSALLENVNLLEQRLKEVEVFERHSVAFDVWLADMERKVGSGNGGELKEKKDEWLVEVADMAAEFEDVVTFFRDIEENIEEDSGRAYRKKVEELQERYGEVGAILSGSDDKKKVKFDLVVESHPSAAADIMVLDNTGLAGAVAEMNEKQLASLTKFDQLCKKMANDCEIAEAAFRDISSTSSSVDDMVDKCERLQNRLSQQKSHVVILEALASDLVGFCVMTKHPEAAEVINIKLMEVVSHFRELETSTNTEHRRLLEAANFAQQILELLEWMMEMDRVIAELQKTTVGMEVSTEETLEKCKSLKSGLEGYRHSIQEVNDEANKIVPHLDPEVAEVFVAKLQELNSNYESLCSQGQEVDETFTAVRDFDLTLAGLSQWCKEVKPELSGEDLDRLLSEKSADFKLLPVHLAKTCGELQPTSLVYFTQKVQDVQQEFRCLAKHPADQVVIEIIQQEERGLEEAIGNGMVIEPSKEAEVWNSMRSLKIWASSRMEQLVNFGPLSPEMKVLKQQIETHMNFQDDSEARLQEVEKVCHELMSSGFTGESSDLETVVQELMVESSKVEKKLEKAMDVSRKFDSQLGDVLSWIEEMEEQVEEKNGEAFKSLCADFEGRSSDLSALHSLTERLVSLCGPSDLFEEVTKVDNRYLEIKRRIEERSKQTEYSALNKGQLMQEVSKLKCWLQTVEKWLLMQQSIREERVASGDVQAEVEKCGNRMHELKMRRMSIESVLKTAHDLAYGLGNEEEDVIVLVQEADYLRGFCDDVQKRCEDHQGMLQVAVQQASREKGVVAVGLVLDSVEDVLGAIVDLRDWLDAVHQWLETQIPSQAIGEGSAAISLMLEDLNKCFEDLKLKQVSLDSISQAAHTFSDKDQGNITEMVMNATSVSKSFQTVNHEVDVKRRTLDKAASVAEKLQTEIEEFVSWLDEMDIVLDDQGKPAADLEALADQLEKHRKLHSAVLLHRDSLHSILQLARPLLRTTAMARHGSRDESSDSDSDSDDSHDSFDDLGGGGGGGRGGSDLQETLYEIKFRYKEAGEKVSVHQKALENAMQQLRDLCTQMQDMQFWILKVDQALMEKVEESDVEHLKAQITAHSAIMDEMEQKKSEYKALNQSCSSFLESSAEQASATLARDVGILKRHWESGESKVQIKQSQLQIMLMKLTSNEASSSSQNSFAQACLVVYSWLGPQEEQLRKPIEMDADLEILQEQYEKWKTIQEKVASRHPDMDHLNDLGEQAIRELSGESSSAIERDMEQINDRWESACILALKRVKEAEDTLKRVREFYTEVIELNKFLSTMEGKLQELKIGAEFQSELEENFRLFSDQKRFHTRANQLADELIEASGNTPSSASLRVQMLRLNNSWSAVEERLHELEHKMAEKSEFLTAMTGFSGWLEEAQGRLDDNDPPLDDRVLVEETLTVLRALEEDLSIHGDELHNLNDVSVHLLAEWPDFKRASSHVTLQTANESFQSLTEGVNEKRKRLTGHQERGQAWRTRMSGVLVLLAKAEKLYESPVHKGCEMTLLQMQMTNLINLQREVFVREGDLAEANRTANEYQRPQLEGVNSRWESMKAAVNTREGEVQHSIGDLENYHSELKTTQKAMMSLEQDIRASEDNSDFTVLTDRLLSCGEMVDGITARGREYVENSSSGSPAATALLKGLDLYSTCFSDLKDLLERLKKNPSEVFGVPESMLITSPLTSVVAVTEQGFRSPSPLHSKPFPENFMDGSKSNSEDLEYVEAVLSAVEKDLGSPQPSASDQEALGLLLDRFEIHIVELKQCRPTLDSLLSTEKPSDQSGSPEFTQPDGSVSQLRRRFESACRSAEDKKKELVSMHETVIIVQSHLQTVEAWISNAKGILETAEHDNDDVIKELRSNLRQNQADLESVKFSAGKICAKGGKEKTSDRKLRQKVHSISSRMDHLSRALTVRKVSSISPSAVVAFREDANSLIGWLDWLEVKLNTATKDFVTTEAAEKLTELEGLRRDFDGKKGSFFSVKEHSGRLLSKGQEGSSQLVTVSKTWTSLEIRWHQLELLLLRKLMYFEGIVKPPAPDVLQRRFDAMYVELTRKLDEIRRNAGVYKNSRLSQVQARLSINGLKDLEHQLEAEVSRKSELTVIGENLEGSEKKMAQLDVKWKETKESLEDALKATVRGPPVFPVVVKETVTIVETILVESTPFSSVETPVHFSLAVDDLLEWIAKVNGVITGSLIVGEASSVDERLRDIEKIEEEHKQKKNMHDHIVESGEKLLAEYGEGSDEASTVAAKTRQLTRSWGNLPSSLASRKASLGPIRTEWSDFACSKETWTEHLALFEGRLKPQVWDITTEPLKAIDKQKEVIEALKDDLGETEAAFEAILKSGRDLRDAYIRERVQPLKDWMQAMEIHWDDVKESLSKRPTELTDLRVQWEQYLDGVFGLHTWLNGIRMKVEEIEPASDESPESQQEQQQKLVQLQSELDSQQPALEGILAAGKNLTELSSSLMDTASLDTRMLKMQKAWDDVKAAIEIRRGELGDPRIKRQRLLREMTSLLAWLSDKMKRMDYILAHPVAGDTTTVKIQKDLHVGEAVGFKTQLIAREGDVQRFLGDGERLLGEGSSNKEDKSMMESIRQVYEELRRSWHEIISKSSRYEDQLDDALKELQKWEELCSELTSCMDRFEEQLKSQGPVSGDSGTLRRQSLEMKEKTNPEMGRMQHLMDELDMSVARQQKKGLDIPDSTTETTKFLKRRYHNDILQGNNRGKAIAKELDRFESQRVFPIPELPEGWIRVETSTGVPYFVNASLDLTQWDHPELSEVVAKFDSKNKHPGYRTAMKLRNVVNKCCLNRVDLSNLVDSAEKYGLSEQNKASVGVMELGNVLSMVYQSVEEEYQDDVDVHMCTDMLLTWLLKAYDPSRSGRISVLSFKICMTILCQGHVEDKYRYIFNLVSDAFGYADRQRLASFIHDANLLSKCVEEGTAFPTTGVKVEASVERCFKKAGTKKFIGLSAFLEWIRGEPETLKWLHYLHKLTVSGEHEDKGRKQRLSGGSAGDGQSCKIS